MTCTEADSAQASNLCTRCGLCCMGVIHNAAVLDDDEIALIGIADKLSEQLAAERR